MDQRPYKLVVRYICDRCRLSWKKEIHDRYSEQKQDTCQRCSNPTNVLCVSNRLNVESEYRDINLGILVSGQKYLYRIEELNNKKAGMD